MKRTGFTLVEMMIAMVITLMIVFAMVQAFRWVGETTTEGRAVIEMLGQIRGARARFEDDLARRTGPVKLEPPCLDSRNIGGYLEVIEGTGSDTNPGRYLVRTPSGLRYNTFAFVDPGADGTLGTPDDFDTQSASLFGDLDDFLCFTARNDENPYRGRYVAGAGPDGSWHTPDDIINTIESPEAEIIWWAELNDRRDDVDGDGVITEAQDTDNDGFIDVLGEGGIGRWDFGETFTIRRRVLLIRPDLNLSTSHTLPNTAGVQVAAFQVNNDISVQLHYDPSTYAYTGLQANSVGDLALRHNRVAHAPIDFTLAAMGVPFGQSQGGYLSPINPIFLPAYTSPNFVGEDVVISNVLAFDLKVWEPNAPVCGYLPANPADGEIPEGVVPGDPGFAPSGTVAQASIVGRGAYVDLGCLAGFPAILAQCSRVNNGIDDNGNGVADPDLSEASMDPIFLGDMHILSRLPAGNFVYDPWPINYENDGFNQDGPANIVPDQGAFTLDGNLNGDYDKAERETSPPYPQRLASLRATIRVYESDTRQVKQASQVVKFGD